VAALKSETARWEKRVEDLLAKYGQVDMAEHSRVQAAQALAEAKTAELQVMSCVCVCVGGLVDTQTAIPRVIGAEREVIGAESEAAEQGPWSVVTGLVDRDGFTAMKELRIVGVSGGISLMRPFRDARRVPSTRLYPVFACTRTPRKFGICPSFRRHFLSPRAKPTIRNFCIAV
jgi:hypothetical protein